MNSVENIEEKILEIFTLKQNYDAKYNDKLLSFLNKAYELVELSEYLYQIEHTIKLNKISLKDFVLNSEICNVLKKNNVNNYSLEELKEFMNRYEMQNASDLTLYKLALELYEKLEEIENLEKDKINYEIGSLSAILEDINQIKNVDKLYYQELYNKIIRKIKDKYLNSNLIDDKLNNYIMQVLNDIFSYYLYGNKEIPLN